MRQTIRLLTFIIFCLNLISCKNTSNEDSRNPYNLDLVLTFKDYQQQVIANPKLEMIDLENTISDIVLDIRYATSNNFTHEVIYSAPKAFARKAVAEALCKVQDSLAFHNIGIKIYDAYRPYAATLRFYEVYPDTNFVANPRYGSRHNRGCAIDITLVEKSTGKEIPMPTEFDDFSEKAHPVYANLPDTVLANRAFLFSIMSHFGFTHYPTEWWHFDYIGWENYPLMDIPFNDLQTKSK